VGDGTVRADGHGQTVTVRPRVGQVAVATIRLQNDGERRDRLRLRAPGSDLRFDVRYTQGHVDVTADVVNGTFLSTERAPGQVVDVLVTITPKRGTPVGATRTLLAVGGSNVTPASTDTVGVVVRIVA
jgi:hypothetical protein